MNFKPTYVLLFVFWFTKISAQPNTFPLRNGSSQLFKNHVYAYGLTPGKAQTGLCVYKLNLQAGKKDSVIIPNLKSVADNYLLLHSDTLHNFLNIYVQKKDHNAVIIYRFNADLKLMAFAEDVDVTRLNNVSMLGANPYYAHNSAYSIISRSDTAGKQFFVNKYALKPVTGNFEYESAWQFPFERKNIFAAKVFYANHHFVFVFVTVNGGTKAGEWVLKINAVTGKLIKGIKINGKSDNAHYFFGNSSVNVSQKSIQLIGQKFSDTEFNLNENKINIANQSFISLYYLNIDSTDEISLKQDFKIPVTEQKTAAKKANSIYQLRINNLKPLVNGKLTFEADIFKSDDHPFCYYYCSSNTFSLTESEEKLLLEKTSISSNPDVERYFLTNDKLDLNGKICVDSLKGFEKLYYKTLTLPVKVGFKTDELNNPYWVLCKSNLKKNIINYSVLAPVKKMYQVKSIEDIEKQANPHCFVVNSNSFIVSYHNTEGYLIVKVFNW